MADHLGAVLPLWLLAPFAGLLLSIAIMPLTIGEWFEHNRSKAIVAGLFGLPVLAYLWLGFGSLGAEEIVSTAREYVSFIALLAALYTISGGIYITGNLLGTPSTNVSFLLAGAVLANIVGTTGAAMVLIRPILRANSERTHSQHVVIFSIFIICNLGGLLTPLGDPPLFLGFLRGIDFFWTLRLLPQWLVGVGLTTAIFLALDVYLYRREPAKALRYDAEDYVPMRVAGKINLLFLAGVVLAVLFSDRLTAAGEVIGFPFLREAVMVAMLLLSLRFGPSGTRASNFFSWSPIIEVAVIFAGIFATMVPALAILRAHGGSLGLTQPWHFFWATGALSSFLDNAPTYLTFTSTAQGYLGVGDMAGLMSTQVHGAIGSAPAAFLAAISTGAVFMGANSYIGNAPNFMVKAVAEHQGVRMPSFGGYMVYSASVLLPIFVVITVLFFW